jgi:hypothetical protein
MPNFLPKNNNTLLIGRITLRNGISLGDGTTDVKFVKNMIITHIYTAKGVKR